MLPWKPRNSIALCTIRLFSFSIVMKMDLILYNSKPDIVQVKLCTYTMTLIIIELYFNHGCGREKSILLCIYMLSFAFIQCWYLYHLLHGLMYLSWCSLFPCSCHKQKSISPCISCKCISCCCSQCGIYSFSTAHLEQVID